MAKDNAQTPTAATNDLPAEVAELRQIVGDLIKDREDLQADNLALTDRLDALEKASGGAGGDALAPAVERELGKIRRPLQEIHDNYFRNVTFEAAEPLVVAPEPAPSGATDGGASTGTGGV